MGGDANPKRKHEPGWLEQCSHCRKPLYHHTECHTDVVHTTKFGFTEYVQITLCRKCYIKKNGYKPEEAEKKIQEETAQMVGYGCLIFLAVAAVLILTQILTPSR